MPDRLNEEAPAKLNPYLRVVRRRDDGYHDVETIVLPIDLADRVSLAPSEEPGFALRVTGPRAAGVPTDEQNLALRAASAFVATTGIAAGGSIEVEKHIPVAAGLGGGSADAAAVVRLLDRAWGSDLGHQELCRIGAAVGSDVPALILRRAVVATGRGDHVAAVDVAPTWWVLVTFDAGIRAEDAYRWWDRSVRRRFERPRPLDEAMRAIAGGNLDQLAATLHNSLEAGVLRRHPSVAQARAVLGRGDDEGVRGAVGTVVSGSGPTVAGLCRDRDHAADLARFVGGIVVRTSG